MGDGFRMIGVRFATGKGLLVAAARGFFPVGEFVPVEPVEIPSDAGAEGAEVFEGNVILAGCCSGSRASDGAQHMRAQSVRRKLPGVHMDIPQRVVFAG